MYKTVHRNIHHHRPEDHLDVAKFQPYRKTGTLGEFIYSTKANDEPVTPGVSNLRPGVLNRLGKYEGGLYANGHLYYTKVIK